MKTLKRLGLLVLTVIAGTAAMAQDNLVLKYDFSTVNGTSVSDGSESGVTAKLMGAAKVEQMGRYRVLNLGNASGYLDLSEAAGSVVKGLGSFSVSAFYRIGKEASLEGNGYFLWCFSTSTACGATTGAYTAYRLNAQRIASTAGGYQNEKGYSIGSPSVQDEWVHVAYTQTGTTGQLYVNGSLAQRITSMPTMGQTFKDGAPAYCWLGRAPFAGDNYLRQTLVYDFRVYNKALSETDVAALAAEREDLDHEFRYGTAGDFTRLQTAVTNAETYLAGLDLTLYPASALMEYRDAIEVAKMLIGEGKVNQNYIDECTAGLAAAKTKFGKTKGFMLDVSDIFDVYDTERGFRHPGGLHTEADFERIRQQLADGNATVTAAWQKLKSAEYAQSGVNTYPVEVIVRGGGVGENYINAARGATMAYQNALRWKIDGTEANARAAVRILMAWANATKDISGDSNYALAAGLYGYEFAQAAELVRDYEGWSREDFEQFRRWMLDLWYRKCTDFMRGRNGTWENVGGQAGQRPGHYWSNWPLCNALAIVSIGILCDDVFIYNQGLSYLKYDQAGEAGWWGVKTYQPYMYDRHVAGTLRINTGCTEYIDNLIPIAHDDARGPYGQLGQMQESGRDQGHATMALGLAIDICQTAWNQGDDLYSYHNNRMAAGVEWMAAYNYNAVDDLPWTEYRYADCRTAWHNTWNMTAPNADSRGQMRPYWARVVGHYEGVKGVKMQYAEKALQDMGIDAGGTGGTSGGYDHLGYSVLTCTYDGMATEETRPTLLTPRMTYGGTTVEHNELGGLTNTWELTPAAKRGLAPGTIVTLSPQLPTGETDTGQWLWNTGERTREITVTAARSYNYRVEYINEHGVKSYQNFALAVDGDCESSIVTPSISYQGNTFEGQTELTVMWGSEVTLSIYGPTAWGYATWDNGQTSASITLPQVTTSRDVQVCYQNQGGRKQLITFHLDVTTLRPDIILNGTTLEDTLSIVVADGDDVVLAPCPSPMCASGDWLWDDGSTERKLTMEDIDTSGEYSVGYTWGGSTTELTYQVYVKETKDPLMEVGNYMIRHRESGRYLTACEGVGVLADWVETQDGGADPTQVWRLDRLSAANYNFISTFNSTYLTKTGTLQERGVYRPHRIAKAKGTDRYAIYNSTNYWTVAPDGSLLYEAGTRLCEFPFEFIAVEDDATGMVDVRGAQEGEATIYDVAGRRLDAVRSRGLYIVNGKKIWR